CGWITSLIKSTKDLKCPHSLFSNDEETRFMMLGVRQHERKDRMNQMLFARGFVLIKARMRMREGTYISM
ncbi:hypothetical protein, partial [Legionella cherrii]|uniref:hypothetical protein n=1 Tax=Legionella cherrii TaxID=28084 RepID=UPI001A95049D